MKYIVKINGKEFFFESVKLALDLVEVTWESCLVVFCQNNWKNGVIVDNFDELKKLLFTNTSSETLIE